MRTFLSLTLIFALLAGCDRHTYVESDFHRYEAMVETDPGAAIEHLRRFIYFNAEHFEAHYAIALAFQRRNMEERDLYLARHYINLAMSLDLDDDQRQRASRMYTGIRIEQGINPESIDGLAELAEYAMEHQDFQRAAEVYLRAAVIGIRNEDYRASSNNVAEALAAAEMSDEKQELDGLSKLTYNSRLAGVAIAQARGRFSEAIELFPESSIEPHFYKPFPAPDYDFLLASQNLALAVTERSGWGARARDVWGGLLQRFSDSDHVSDEMSPELFAALQDADLTNEAADNPELDMVVARIWGRQAEVLRGDTFSGPRLQAKARSAFYYRRAGEPEQAKRILEQ